MDFTKQNESLEQTQELRQQEFDATVRRVNSGDPSVAALYRNPDVKACLRYAGYDYPVSSLCLAYITNAGSQFPQPHRFNTSDFNGLCVLCKSTPDSLEDSIVYLADSDGNYVASSKDDGLSVYVFAQSETAPDELGGLSRITVVGASTYPNRLVDPFGCNYVAFTSDSELCRPLVELFGRYYFRGATPIKDVHLERLQLEMFDSNKGKFPRIGDPRESGR